MKRSQMFIQDRRKKILDQINSSNQIVSSEILAETLSASPITIRRDLQFLASENLIRKVHGGAQRIEQPQKETAFFSQPESMDFLSENEVLIRKLARQAAELINDQEIVFINSSSTASYVIEYLENKHVTIVTNNLSVSQRKRSPHVTLIYTGGQAMEGTHSLTGVYAIDLLNKITADKCILGVRGISESVGITSSILEETFVNQQMIQQTQGDVIVVADNRKVGNSDRFFSADIQKINVLITDLHADPMELAFLRKKGIRIISI